MLDKNKEAIRIIEENKLTNVYSPEEQIRLDLEKAKKEDELKLIKELLDDVRKIRNDLVAQANPHFQTLTNLIYKWEMKILEKIDEDI